MAKCRYYIIVTLVALFQGTAMHADDAAYAYLTLETSDGTTQSVALSSLTLAISDGRLVLTNTAGTQTFALTELSKMYFTTNNTTGLKATTFAEDTPVEIHSLTGIQMGTYDNISQARTALESGIYVVKAMGRTYKIAVK